jgi:hypothetical protein
MVSGLKVKTSTLFSCLTFAGSRQNSGKILEDEMLQNIIVVLPTL